jgi:TatD DNase family protein
VGANLLDERFVRGVYRGTFRHEPDLDRVVDRAVQAGVKRVVLTAGTPEESRHAVAAVREWRVRFPQIHWSCTVGVHPTRTQQVFVDRRDGDDESGQGQMTDDEILDELLEVALDGMSDRSVVAIGEIGLDYDRLEFSAKAVQHKYLERQLQVLAKGTGLPLFLHNRNAQDNLRDLLERHADCWRSQQDRDDRVGGVVHSFDDSVELAGKFIDMGLFIGINGCSLKTQENLETVRQLPLDRLVLETDCPYCEIRSTHAGYRHLDPSTVPPARPEKKFQPGLTVKSRQEPCHIVQVAQVVASVKGVDASEVASACYDNAMQLFFHDEAEKTSS